MRSLLLLSATITLLFDLVVSASAVKAAMRWEAYDNYPCKNDACGNVTEEFGIVSYNRTVLSEACVFRPNCRAEGWTFGSWPMLNGKGQPASNGGVPQLGNLTLHLNKLAAGVDAWIPDKNFDGNVVLDWEAWTPNWDFCDSDDPHWMSVNYQLYSIEVVKKQHPTWTNLTEIVAEAKSQFEEAGLEFMTETLKVLRKLRPKAKMGYYGYPRIAQYELPVIGTIAREANDKLKPIWEASSTYFPSVYLPSQRPLEPFDLWQLQLAIQVNTTIVESIRVAETFHKLPILPYHWSLYHNGTTTLLPSDVELVLNNTYAPPLSTGLVIWGAGGYPKDFPDFMKTVQGPTFKRFQSWANECSQVQCSGHGWCNKAWTNSNCVCDEGFSGLLCNTRA